MSLRLRLIVAFFLLSVVPLGAVTFYAYTSNARALRDFLRDRIAPYKLPKAIAVMARPPCSPAATSRGCAHPC